MLRVEILRVSGAHEAIEIPRGANAMQQIAKAIGAETLDTVNLRDGRVMLVDDDGYVIESRIVSENPLTYRNVPMAAKKPVNPEATQLYWKVCRPGTTHQVVGDVAILWDRDLAGEGE